jgi:hypothetical protein
MSPSIKNKDSSHKAAERIHINALCTKKVKLKFVSDDNKTIDLINTMTATFETPYNLITGPPGIIKFDKDGITYSVIQNCSPYAI